MGVLCGSVLGDSLVVVVVVAVLRMLVPVVHVVDVVAVLHGLVAAVAAVRVLGEGVVRVDVSAHGVPDLSLSITRRVMVVFATRTLGPAVSTPGHHTYKSIAIFACS
ncbi:hypothetical protein GCM10009796_16760 [Microbacterium koreense]